MLCVCVLLNFLKFLRFFVGFINLHKIMVVYVCSEKYAFFYMRYLHAYIKKTHIFGKNAYFSAKRIKKTL